MVKNLAATAGDAGLIPSLGRFHMPMGPLSHMPQLLNPQAAPEKAPQGEAARHNCKEAAARHKQRKPKRRQQ